MIAQDTTDMDGSILVLYVEDEDGFGDLTVVSLERGSSRLDIVTEPTAVAAVVIFRGAVYWIPTILGGIVVAWIGSGLGIGLRRG